MFCCARWGPGELPRLPGTCALRQGQAPLSPPARLGRECVPAGSARPCVRAPARSRRAHAPRASALAHFSQNGSAHARSSTVPLHSPAPLPPDDFMVSKPRSPPRPPAFYPGSRSTRRPAGECQAVRGGGDPAPRRDPAGARPRPSETNSVRVPRGLPSPRVGPGSRCRRRARAAQVKEEKKGGKNRKRRPLPQRSAAGLGQAGRLTLEPAIQGRRRPSRSGRIKKKKSRRRRLREGGPRAACGGRGAAAASRSPEPARAGRRAGGGGGGGGCRKSAAAASPPHMTPLFVPVISASGSRVSSVPSCRAA